MLEPSTACPEVREMFRDRFMKVAGRFDGDPAIALLLADTAAVIVAELEALCTAKLPRRRKSSPRTATKPKKRRR